MRDVARVIRFGLRDAGLEGCLESRRNDRFDKLARMVVELRGFFHL